jgi:hypothetical protein
MWRYMSLYVRLHTYVTVYVVICLSTYICDDICRYMSGYVHMWRYMSLYVCLRTYVTVYVVICLSTYICDGICCFSSIVVFLIPFLTLYLFMVYHISSLISWIVPQFSKALFVISVGNSGGRLASHILRRPIPAGRIRKFQVSPSLCSYSECPFVRCGMLAACCAEFTVYLPFKAVSLYCTYRILFQL